MKNNGKKKGVIFNLLGSPNNSLRKRKKQLKACGLRYTSLGDALEDFKHISLSQGLSSLDLMREIAKAQIH